MEYEVLYIIKRILLSTVTFFVFYYYNLFYEEKVIKSKLPKIKDSFVWTNEFKKKYIFDSNKKIMFSFGFMFILLVYLETLLTKSNNGVFLYYQIVLIIVQGIYTYHNYNKLNKETKDNLLYEIANRIFKQYKQEWEYVLPSDDNILVLNILQDIKNNKKFLTEELIYLLLEIRICEDRRYGYILNEKKDELIEKLKFQYYSSFDENKNIRKKFIAK